MLHNLLISKGVKISQEQRDLLPKKFTNPFSYLPHPLCREAADAVQKYLESQPQWAEELSAGKMFGVLVVETPAGELGYLAAFSGNLLGRNDLEFFVPPVYDLLNPDNFFKVGEREISALNGEIDLLDSSDEKTALVSQIECVQMEFENEIFELKRIYKKGRVERERLRREFAECGGVMGEEVLQIISRESQFQKAEIRRAEKIYRETLAPLQARLDSLNGKVDELRRFRREKSAALQEEIFRKFKFLNALGEQQDLLDIFTSFYKEQIMRTGKSILPPGGAGECAAPKMLQYAYLHGMRPVAMGEFWWGNSPRGEIRKHGEFYPSCKGKCAPILDFMLRGLPVDSAGVHISYGSCGSSDSCSELEILFEDQFLLAVNKPAGILSVPGKETGKSGTDFLTEIFGNGKEFFVVHRLDMHTSGVLLVAKNEEVYKELQRQFAAREVRKIYVAVLDGAVDCSKSGEGVKWTGQESGVISLPLAADYTHRPAQIVDFEQGKEAVTHFQIKKIVHGFGASASRTLVEFYPMTGRTHQLRVHSAHPLGLNTPIEGDLLYGKPAQRLMLHAVSLQFKHPVTAKLQKITAPLPAEFRWQNL